MKKGEKLIIMVKDSLDNVMDEFEIDEQELKTYETVQLLMCSIVSLLSILTGSFIIIIMRIITMYA